MGPIVMRLWEACYAFNSPVNSSSGYTPAELTFGRKLRVPLDKQQSFLLHERTQRKVIENVQYC